MKKTKPWMFIGTIVFSILMLVLLTSIALNLITSNQCKNICNSKKAITFQKISNGELNLKDACVCYYKNSVETIMLN